MELHYSKVMMTFRDARKLFLELPGSASSWVVSKQRVS